MRFLICFLLTCMVSPALAGSNASEYKAAFRFNHGQGFQNDQLGEKVIRDNARDLKVQYNFARQGGAVGTLKLIYPPDPAFPGGAPSGTLPANAIVTGCYIDVITAPTSGGSATIALSTGQGAADLLAATAKASFTGIMACIPVGTAATAIKLTADSVPTLTIATAALTAGVINVHIQYVLSDK
jgi:hypothetical protein